MILKGFNQFKFDDGTILEEVDFIVCSDYYYEIYKIVLNTGEQLMFKMKLSFDFKVIECYINDAVSINLFNLPEFSTEEIKKAIGNTIPCNHQWEEKYLFYSKYRVCKNCKKEENI